MNRNRYSNTQSGKPDSNSVSTAAALDRHSKMLYYIFEFIQSDILWNWNPIKFFPSFFKLRHIYSMNLVLHIVSFYIYYNTFWRFVKHF